MHAQTNKLAGSGQSRARTLQSESTQRVEYTLLSPPVQSGKGNNRKCKLTAFDDKELRDWLIDLIVQGPEGFLSAVAEAVIAASMGDYAIVRPALMELKQKHERKNASHK